MVFEGFPSVVSRRISAYCWSLTIDCKGMKVPDVLVCAQDEVHFEERQTKKTNKFNNAGANKNSIKEVGASSTC